MGSFPLAEIPGGDFSKTLGWIDGHAFHEQAKLPDRYVSYISWIFWPFKSGTRAVEPLVVQDEAVAIPAQAFQPIAASVTEQEQIVSKRIHVELLFHDDG